MAIPFLDTRYMIPGTMFGRQGSGKTILYLITKLSAATSNAGRYVNIVRGDLIPEKCNLHPGGDIRHAPTTDGNLYLVCLLYTSDAADE